MKLYWERAIFGTLSTYENDFADMLVLIANLQERVETLEATVVPLLRARQAPRTDVSAKPAGVQYDRRRRRDEDADVRDEVEELRVEVELLRERRKRRPPHDLEAAAERAEHARLHKRIGARRGCVSVETWRRWHGGATPKRRHFASEQDWLDWDDRWRA